jgi:hypothetical protein
MATKESDKDKKKAELKQQLKDHQAELKNITRQILKARDLSEQRYLKQRQKETERQITRLNVQLKEI